MTKALDRICAEAEAAIDEGYSLVVLSDRAIGRDRVPLSSLLATGAVHHHLVRKTKRTRIGIVVESGEAREVHHHCLLVGYGADAINPYLAFEALWQSRREGLLQRPEGSDKSDQSGEGKEHPAIEAGANGEVYDPVTKEDHELVYAYRKGVAKGMLKVMAKMGISTLQSYKGAQIFEAVGLQGRSDRPLLRRHGQPHSGRRFRRAGRGSAAAARARLSRASRRSAARAAQPGRVPLAGRRRAAHVGPAGDRRPASRRAQQQRRRLPPLRRAREPRRANPLRTARPAASSSPARTAVRFRSTKCMPAKDIVKRFCTGAMSFGSISAEAHETLAIAMNRLGGKSNTGEGGEDPERFKPLPNGDSKRSAIKQVASGRFGVTIWYLANADELQIKISQGAKPGEGGELPGRKVDD